MSKNWSLKATKNSNALDLEPGLFTWSDPQKIALSLKNSAEKSIRRKSKPYQSAMSMICFYINRSGPNIPPAQRAVLERAKVELHDLFKKK